jgi:hypothetical protein
VPGQEEWSKRVRTRARGPRGGSRRGCSWIRGRGHGDLRRRTRRGRPGWRLRRKTWLKGFDWMVELWEAGFELGLGLNTDFGIGEFFFGEEGMALKAMFVYIIT